MRAHELLVLITLVSAEAIRPDGTATTPMPIIVTKDANALPPVVMGVMSP